MLLLLSLFLILYSMNLEQIAPNLYISDNLGWKEYKKEYIHDLLKSIDINFSKALETLPFQSHNCFIDYTHGNPLCSKLMSVDCHIIRISAYGDYLARWVYEFSHEYCHHLINGAFEADITGVIWFEEAICELASMYHLYQTHKDWSASQDINKLQNAHSFQAYLDELLKKNLQLVNVTHHQGWLSSWVPFLSEPIYYRDHYNSIAVRMLPLFLENPHLWKIIAHFGDSRKWNSLQDLFDYLFETVDDSYSYHLKKLKDLLFS